MMCTLITEKLVIEKLANGNIKVRHTPSDLITVYTPEQVECAYKLIKEKPIFTNGDFEFQKQGSHIMYRPVKDKGREDSWRRVQDTFKSSPEFYDAAFLRAIANAMDS